MGGPGEGTGQVGVGSPSGPVKPADGERQTAQGIIAAHRLAARQAMAGWVVLTIGLGAIVGVVGALCLDTHVIGTGELKLLLLFTLIGMLVTLGISAGVIYDGLAQRTAEALLDEGHPEPAVRLLKKCTPFDTVRWLIAQAYDRQGARLLALESYREYLRRHKHGKWAVEARVRVAELEAELAAAAPTPPPVQVQAEPSREPRLAQHCPFCKDAIGGDAVTAECSACGTPHHLACYEEQRGCAVYGCKSHKARARVPEGPA